MYISHAQQFEQIQNPSETFIWSGKPNRLSYLRQGLSFLAFGLLWLAFDVFIMGTFFLGGLEGNAPEFDFRFIAFFAIHLIPFWGSFGYFVYLLLNYRNAYYALTNQRVLLRSGVFGVSYKSLPYEKIVSAEVKSGLLENSRGLGSIRIFSGEVKGRNRSRKYDSFFGITTPYDVYRILQTNIAE